MKTIFVLLTFLSIISCSSYQKSNAKDLNGIYEYKAANQAQNTYLVFDTQNKKQLALFYGTENQNQEIYYFENKIEKLKIDQQEISFEIGKRELYETSRLKIVKSKEQVKNERIVGISKEKIKIVGKINDEKIKLPCVSEGCQQKEMIFLKIKTIETAN